MTQPTEAEARRELLQTHDVLYEMAIENPSRESICNAVISGQALARFDERAAVRRAVVEEIVEALDEQVAHFMLAQAEDEHSPAFMQADRRGAFVMVSDVRAVLDTIRGVAAGEEG